MTDLPALTTSSRIDRVSGWTIAFNNQINVFHALVLHDIKSRFFGNGLGYVVTILWPGAHLAVIMGIYAATGRGNGYGTSPLLFVATGVLPYICWNYISRFCMMGVIQNKSALSYPIINILDIIFSRIFLEIVTCTIVTFLLLAFLMCNSIDVVPIHPAQAAFGLLSAVLLGIGFAVLNASIVLIFPLWILGYVLVLISFWFTSGVVINPEVLPEQIGYWLSWNPLLHCIEWLRSAYYDDYPARLLDKGYVLEVGFGSLALGLLMQRTMKRYLLK